MDPQLSGLFIFVLMRLQVISLSDIFISPLEDMYVRRYPLSSGFY